MKKILIGALLLTGCALPVMACTGISATAKDGGYVQARTIEWGDSYLPSQYVVIPCGHEMISYTPKGMNGAKFRARYGVVGLSIVLKDFVVEGLNEAGLSAGLFYFPHYGNYPAYDAKQNTRTVADLQLVAWMLSQFSTIEEIKAAMQETITGEQEGILLPYEYFSDLKIKGKPIYVTAKVTANVAGKYGSVYNKFLLGAEWSTKGNKGEGKTFDANRTPSQNLRPRSFKDIPFIQEYTGFIEDKVTFTMNKKSLELSAGLRFTTIETRDYDYGVVFDPRFNARFVFLDNKWNRKGFQHLSIRAGWGILHKMPGLAYLYPDPSYVDRSSFSYNDEENNYSLGVMTTMVTETANRMPV